MLEVCELFVGMLQKLFNTLLFGDLGTVDLGFKHETFGVYEQVALPTVDLLSAVVAAFLSAYSGSLDYASTGLRISLQAQPKAFPDSLIDPLPSAVDGPSPEIVVDGRPPRKVVREHAPLTAASQDVEEDGIY